MEGIQEPVQQVVCSYQAAPVRVVGLEEVRSRIREAEVDMRGELAGQRVVRVVGLRSRDGGMACPGGGVAAYAVG